jgi:hypothetical protein
MEERKRHGKPEKGPKRRRPLTAGISDIERLDALMRSISGRTLAQFWTDAFQRGYKQGIEDGYKEGIKGGKRVAKGKAEFPKNVFKPRGRPPVLDPILVEQFIATVNSLIREEEISLPAAVSRYCDVMVRAWKDQMGGPVPERDQLLRLYQREQRKRKAIDDAPDSRDKV